MLLPISLALYAISAITLHSYLRNLNTHRVKTNATSFSDLYLDTKGSPIPDMEGVVDIPKSVAIRLTVLHVVLNATAFILATTYFIINYYYLSKGLTIDYINAWSNSVTGTLNYLVAVLGFLLPLTQGTAIRNLYCQHYEHYRKAREKRANANEFKQQLAVTTREHNGWF